jgi:hypothetical protein
MTLLAQARHAFTSVIILNYYMRLSELGTPICLILYDAIKTHQPHGRRLISLYIIQKIWTKIRKLRHLDFFLKQ